MQIIIRLVGAFRVERFKEETREVPSGTRIQDVLESLQLPAPLIGTVLLNGVHAESDALLAAGDCLTILPLLDGG